MIVLFIIFVLAGMSTPKFLAARGRANTRACYANQKTLEGTIDMFNLDRNTHVVALGSVVATLVSSGYIQMLPDDPGKGPDTFKNYVLSYRPGCDVHGARPVLVCKLCGTGPQAQVICTVHGAR